MPVSSMWVSDVTAVEVSVAPPGRRYLVGQAEALYDSRAQLSFEVVSGSTVLPLAQLARPPSPVPSCAITTYSVVLTTDLYCSLPGGGGNPDSQRDYAATILWHDGDPARQDRLLAPLTSPTHPPLPLR